MQVMEKAKEKEFLGREFLLWLWVSSEAREGFFDLGESGEVELIVDGKIKLQSGEEDDMATITCSGRTERLREARFALSEGKAVTQAQLRLTVGEDRWSFVLDGKWLNLHSLKGPKVFRDKDDHPDSIFYEKLGFIERPVAVVDRLFAEFARLRVSPEWEAETVPAISQWVMEGKGRGSS